MPGFLRRIALRSPCWHEWVLLGVLVGLTDRYRWMMDDAFIYFRYADNLLFLERGLVYNPGEYVEGYSSPLWMLWVTALRALGLDFYLGVRLSALACAAAYGLGLVWVNRRLSPGKVTVNFPLAASAAHYGLTTHFSSGLETPLVQLLAPLYAAALLQPGRAWLQCVLAAAPLVRPECGLLWVGFLPWALLRTRRIPWWFLGSALGLNGVWLAFRVIYYADFLPNTFYVKDGSHWDWGLSYLWNVVSTHHWLWVLAGLTAAAWFGRRAFRHRVQLGPRVILLTTAAAYAFYVARIGGDMLYHRYAALPVCLLLCAVSGVAESVVMRAPSAWQTMLGSVVALVLCMLFGAAYPPQLESHPFWLSPVSHNWQAVADPNWHRSHASLTYAADRAGEDRKQLSAYERARTRIHPPPPEIRVEGFCKNGYRRFDSQIIQEYGLTDAVLAHLPRTFGRPGHKIVHGEAHDLRRLLTRAREKNVSAWWELRSAPPWVRDNREALALLDAKVHNRHDPAANLKLALTHVVMH